MTQGDCPNACLLTTIDYAAETAMCGGPQQDPCQTGAVVRFHYAWRDDIVTRPTGLGFTQLRRRGTAARPWT